MLAGDMYCSSCRPAGAVRAQSLPEEGEAFRLGGPGQRRAGLLGRLMAWLLGALVFLACRSAPAPLPNSHDQESPASVLSSFVEDALSHRFDLAYPLLAASLRDRYTPQTLERDFGLDPNATVRLERARKALQSPPERQGDEVTFRLENGWTVRLVREPMGYRIAALE